MAQPKLDTDQVWGWLKMVCPPTTPGQLWIGSASSRFAGRRFDPTDLTSAVEEVRRLDGLRDPGIFLRMGTIRHGSAPTGRGTALDSATLYGLWVDLDIEGPGHKHDPAKHDGRALPPDEDTARKFVDHLPEPTAWHRSGGGLYAYWLPTDGPWDLSDSDQRDRLEKLSTRLQWATFGRAYDLGYHYGTGVGDLARILRIPGTVNRKVAGAPTQAEIEWGGGPKYTLDTLDAAIPELPDAAPGLTVRSRVVAIPPASTRSDSGGAVAAAIPRVPAATIQAPSGATRSRLRGPARAFEDPPGAVGPLDDFVNRNDLRELIVADGWTYSHSVQGRDHYARPGKHPREGASGNVQRQPDGRQTLFVFSEEAGLPTYRGLNAAVWYAHRFHGGDTRAAASALRRAGYGTPAESGAVSSGYSGATGTDSDGVSGTSIAPGVAETFQATDEPAWWGQRPLLRAIYREAQLARVSPWGLLGAVLADACSRIGPHVALPARGGRLGSLNLFVALVGRPGKGKGVTMDTARQLLGPSSIPRHEIATGQGIDAAYASNTKDGNVQYNDAVLWEVPEIDTITASTKMTGSNLMPTLRKAYSGEALGGFTKDRTRRALVKAHRYRAALVVGAQPERAAALLDDAAGGTPQRFLWLRVQRGPEEPAFGQLTPRAGMVGPDPVHWWTDYLWSMSQGEMPEGQPVTQKETVLVTLSPAARDEINAQQQAAYDAGEDDDEDDETEAHSLLTQLKTAAILAMLDRRSDMNDQDWSLAKSIWLKSQRVVWGITRGRIKRAEKARQARAELEARASLTVQDVTDQALEDKCRARVLKLVTEAAPEPISYRTLHRNTAAKQRDYLLTVLGDLVREQRLVRRVGEASGNEREEYTLGSP